MSPLYIALLCAILCLASAYVIKSISRAIPIVAIGLPVIMCGLWITGVTALLAASGAPVLLIAMAALVSGGASFYWGCKLAIRWFSEGLARRE